MRKAAISVIIPAYNAADTIQQCVESVLYQTVSIHEILVINDGSTDNTEEILKDLIKKSNLKNLRIISQPNGGPSKARNIGIKEARGEWIAFLDSDDRWLPEKIAKQIEIFEYHKDFSIIGTQLLTSVGKRYKYSIKEISFKKMLFKNYLFTSTVLVQRKILLLFFFDENKKYSEDYKLWLQIVNKFKGVVINEGLVIYSARKKELGRKTLSDELWEMEKNEIENFRYFFKEKTLTMFQFYIVVIFSLVKFCKRFLQTKLITNHFGRYAKSI